MNTLLSFYRDARNIQIIYLSTFLTYGILQLGWEISTLTIIAVVGSSSLTQLIWLWIANKKPDALKSGIITGLGLCLLLKSTSSLTMVVSAVLAISSKYVLRIKNKHLFNPANFGIVAAILLFDDAWISPGQWGSNAIFLFILIILGGLILHHIGRLETSLVFLGSLFLMEYSRTVLYQGWEMDVLFHKFSNGTLLLFSFFMITDPMTIPNAKKSRIIWALILAGSTFFLTNWMQIYTAPMWILFAMTPLTVLLDKIYPEMKYEWKSNNTNLKIQ